AARVVDDVAKAADDVASVADDVAKAADDIASVGDGASSVVDDIIEGPSNVKNPEAHSVVNYAKLKEQYRVAELGNDIVDNLNSTGQLPSNYITKNQARALGWSEGKALNNYALGKALG
ncbi:MAG: hypothetical protein ACRCS8_00690, partial [Brevinema sp.]